MKEGSRLYISSGGVRLYSYENNHEAIVGSQRKLIIETATHRGVYWGEGDGHNMRAVGRENQPFFVHRTTTGVRNDYVPVIERCELDAEAHGNNGPVTVILV